jgi:hypothetical protein
MIIVTIKRVSNYANNFYYQEQSMSEQETELKATKP